MTPIDYPAALIAADALRRARQRVQPSTPAALLKRMDPSRVTIGPVTALISDVLADAIHNPDRRYVVSTPPRVGKTQLASIIAPLYALMRDPDAEVMLKAYGDQLAHEMSSKARSLVGEHADVLGFTIDPSKTAVDRWTVRGRRGGVLAGGIASPSTGFGVSGSGVLIVDDPIKSASDADSPAHRRRLVNAFQSDLISRLHPGSSVVVISTRWHPEDLAGSLLAEEGGDWVHVNVPAVATAGVPDALGREPGAALTNPLGFTAADYERLRGEVGSRTWAALYLGAPAAPEGSLIFADWLDGHRLPAAPARPSRIVVAVDPADSGKGDKTGIVAASLAPDGTVAIIADVSEHLTSDQWAQRAVDLAVMLGASTIAVETFSAGTTYKRLVSDAVARTGRRITVTGWPPSGAAARDYRGDSLSRSQGLIAALETGRCRIAGHLPGLEGDMLGWSAGQHQPDSVAAAVIAHDVLARGASQRMTLAAPTGTLRDGLSRGPAAMQVVGSRPGIDAIVAAAAARKRAEAEGRDPSADPVAARAHSVIRRQQQWGRKLGG
ncbi:terminase large subunit domain-containing protein [Rhodococcus aetherivorans]|uniref:terminase large subunit domain-containing protein n=1 Tax=Rhodococcus aetherivorans TaxID=191292 RepID=UPI001E619F07|nr:terminase family protein [Rhodococcus aetherivorans]UGQ43408.1 terminase family protein [Rhodococcus aetherivorans]